MPSDTQLAFEFGELSSPDGQRKILTQRFKNSLVDIYATAHMLGPKTSKSKSAALGAVLDLDTRLTEFLDSIFGKLD